MARPIGLPKSGGRKSGTPNKRTRQLQEVLDDYGVDLPRRLIDLMPQLDPRDQADVLLDLMSYIYPKRKAVEHTGPGGDPLPCHQQATIQIQSILSDEASLEAAALLAERIASHESNS